MIPVNASPGFFLFLSQTWFNIKIILNIQQISIIFNTFQYLSQNFRH